MPINIKVKSGEVYLDGENSGRVLDVMENYPELKQRIEEAVELGEEEAAAEEAK